MAKEKVAKLRIRKSNHALNRTLAGDMGINIMLLVVGTLMALPMVYNIMQAFKPLNEMFLYPPRFFVINPTLKNFTDLFRLMGTSWVPFSRYIFNTAFIAIAGTFGNVVLSSMAAYSLSKLRYPGRNFLFKMIVYSLMFNSTVTGITSFIVITWMGWVDTYWAIIVPAWCSTFGLYLLKQFMEDSVHDEILESARLDGASEFRVMWTIALPMVKPAILTLIIFSFQGLWNTGSSIYVYSEQLKSFSYAIGQVLAGGIARSGAAAASSVIMMSVPILVFVVSQANVIETMSSSGLKG